MPVNEIVNQPTPTRLVWGLSVWAVNRASGALLAICFRVREAWFFLVWGFGRSTSTNTGGLKLSDVPIQILFTIQRLVFAHSGEVRWSIFALSANLSKYDTSISLAPRTPHIGINFFRSLFLWRFSIYDTLLSKSIIERRELWSHSKNWPFCATSKSAKSGAFSCHVMKSVDTTFETVVQINAVRIKTIWSLELDFLVGLIESYAQKPRFIRISVCFFGR